MKFGKLKDGPQCCLSQPNSQESSNLQWMKNRIHKQDFQSLGSRILKRDLLDSKGNFEVSPGLCPWTSLGYSTLPNFQLYVSSLLWLRRSFLGKNQIFPTGSLMNVRETKRERVQTKQINRKGMWFDFHVSHGGENKAKRLPIFSKNWRSMQKLKHLSYEMLNFNFNGKEKASKVWRSIAIAVKKFNRVIFLLQVIFIELLTGKVLPSA